VLGRFLVTACAALGLQALAGDSLREHVCSQNRWQHDAGFFMTAEEMGR
jgi:hypothetical protein